MRRAALLLLALALTARADWAVVQKVEGGMTAGQITLRLKGDKARVELNNQISVITDLATGDSVTLNNASRTLIRIPGKEAAKIRETTLGLKEGAKTEAPKLTPTGKKEQVDTYDCDIFTWEIGELKVTDWIAPSYPNFQPLQASLAKFQNAGLAAAAQPLMPPLDQFPGMVIKREMLHKNIKTTTTLVSAKEAPQDPNLFAAPKDYKEQPALELPSPAPAPAK